MTVLAAVLAALAAALLPPPARPVPRHLPPDDLLGPPPGGHPSAALLRGVAVAGSSTAVLLLVPGAAGWLLTPVVAVGVWLRSASWEGAGARRRHARLEAALPHAVDLLVAALAAGAAPGDALARVARVLGGPVEEELRQPLSLLALGADPVQVWRGLSRHPQLGRLGTTLARAAESGAPVTDALVRLAQELRAAARSQVEAQVRQVEVRATVPLAACLLPAFVLVGVVPLVAGAVRGLVLG